MNFHFWSWKSRGKSMLKKGGGTCLQVRKVYCHVAMFSRFASVSNVVSVCSQTTSLAHQILARMADSARKLWVRSSASALRGLQENCVVVEVGDSALIASRTAFVVQHWVDWHLQGFIQDFTSGGVSKNEGVPPLPPSLPFPSLPFPSPPLAFPPFP